MRNISTFVTMYSDQNCLINRWMECHNCMICLVHERNFISQYQYIRISKLHTQCVTHTCKWKRLNVLFSHNVAIIYSTSFLWVLSSYNRCPHTVLIFQRYMSFDSNKEYAYSIFIFLLNIAITKFCNVMLNQNENIISNKFQLINERLKCLLFA